jgi:hypothetical protein
MPRPFYHGLAKYIITKETVSTQRSQPVTIYFGPPNLMKVDRYVSFAPAIFIQARPLLALNSNQFEAVVVRVFQLNLDRAASA